MEEKEIRINILSILTYLVGIILIATLFNMQIVKGEKYREISNSRLTKVANIEGARGKILDRNGQKYADTILEYDVEVFKSKIDSNKFNVMAITLLDILEKNGEQYINKFPINIKDFTFINLNQEEQVKWKKELGLPEQASAEECFLRLKEIYDINSYENSDTLKVLKLRELMRTNPNSVFMATVVSKNIKRETAIKITENSDKMPGVNINTRPIRNYEKKEEASHVLGYVGPISEKEYEKYKKDGYTNQDRIGKNGIEKTFEEILKGKSGKKYIEMNIDGSVIGENVITHPKDGGDVVLTIDSRLQSKVQSLLINQLNVLKSGKYHRIINPKGASAVVMNTKTGEILSMVSYPEYEPQKFIKGISTKDWDEYLNSPYKPLLNRSVQGLYSPASTFKMSTAMAALDTGAVRVDEGIVCMGKYPKYHRPECWIYKYGMTHGWQNVTLAIKNSCNYYFYEVGDRLGEEKIAEYAKYFGLGRRTGIEFVGEEEGFLATKETAAKKGQLWNPGDPLSAAIGQSYNSFTPIQMAKYISMLSNGGKEIHPTIIKSIINSDGSYLNRDEIKKISDKVTGYKEEKVEEKNFKQEHLDAVRRGMYLVTQPGGTAYRSFSNFNIKVAAKTGTAEANENTNAIFASYAPFDNPEIAVIVVIENGYEGTFQGDLVREIYREYFNMARQSITETTEAINEGEFLVN